MISKKFEKMVKEYVKRTPKEDLSFGKIANGGTVTPGPYNFLPVLCTMAGPVTERVVLITCFLLRIVDDKHVGVLDWILPWNPRTEAGIARLLVGFGWDGRVWPDEEGWPGTDIEGNGLRTILSASGLRATLTFPPSADGSNRTLRQEVLKMSSAFPLCPDVHNDIVVPPEHLEKLRKLMEDPSIFQRSASSPMKPSRLGRAVGLKAPLMGPTRGR
jgi:hypothetical protein